VSKISTKKRAASGRRKPKVPRPKKYTKADGSKYDSVWESVLHESILKDWYHHADKIHYVIEHTYMPGAKRRKDGTKRSHAEWAGVNGFRWFSEDSIPNEWIDVSAKETDEFKKRNDKINLEMQ
jgi:hypothetical protein